MRSVRAVVQPAGGLGDGAAHRRVDRERVRELVGGERLRDRDRDRVDQLAGARADHDPADDDAGAGPAEQLHEAVADALHLGARVARPAAASRTRPSISPASTAFCDQPTVAISGAVKTLEETGLEVERRDRVAEEVPHRDPALHRGDRREHQHAGAVAGGVHAAGGGARDPVDLDEAAVVERRPRPPRGRGRRCSGPSRAPAGSASPRPCGRRSASRSPSSPSRVTDSIRDLRQHGHAAPRRRRPRAPRRRRRPRRAAPGRGRRPATTSTPSAL